MLSFTTILERVKDGKIVEFSARSAELDEDQLKKLETDFHFRRWTVYHSRCADNIYVADKSLMTAEKFKKSVDESISDFWAELISY